MTSARRHLSAFAALALTAMLLPIAATSVAAAGATVPAGFRDELVWSLPDKPMVVAFAPTGKVYRRPQGRRHQRVRQPDRHDARRSS